jgi:hypothetical protein
MQAYTLPGVPSEGHSTAQAPGKKTNITPIDKSSFFISSFILLVVHFFLVLVAAELIL